MGDQDPLRCNASPDIPSRSELWMRVQLARACLQHGRVDPAELLAILDGASIVDLMRREP